MGESFIDIGFEPSGRTVSVLPGSCLLEAAAQAGLTIDTPCGGGATCGKCRVRFTAAAPPATDSDVDLLSPEEQESGWRLACRCHPRASCRVEIPVGSLFGGPHQILHSSAASAPQLDGGVRKVYVQLTRPGLRDAEADVERLVRKTGPCQVPLGLLRSLHEKLDREAYCGTAVIADETLLDFEPGDTTGSCFGVAIDIGYHDPRRVVARPGKRSGIGRGVEIEFPSPFRRRRALANRARRPIARRPGSTSAGRARRLRRHD